MDRNAKFAVSRLHRNLGHISGKELIKLFTLNGITSDVFMKLCKVMECKTCNRAKGPSQPNPAAPPQFIGLFGDQVQMDIVYVRDLTSRNYIVLGIIDEATHLHVAIRIPSRKPADTFRAFRTAWITPFGAPLILRTDPDGSWGGEFAEQLDAIGCFFDPVPPEAHHRIGSIERHNHLLRIIIEKLVESQGCVTEEHFDNIIAAATFAKNSGTRSSGRPPYVAAFGRIPRVGLDFINDPHSLTAGGTLREAQQQAALLRAEAMKTIAETSASAAFRRAILRKTNNENTDNLEPGALVAYWRWTVRSHRKRGGYRMARYIGRDPDRSLWVQTGTNTVKVAPNQIRRALGYESWTPSPEDMASLRQAQENLRNDENIEDETLPHAQPSEEMEDLDDLYVPDTPPLLEPPAVQPIVQTQEPPHEPPPQSVINLNVDNQVSNTNLNINQSQFGISHHLDLPPVPPTPARRTRTPRARSRTPQPRVPRPEPQPPLPDQSRPSSASQPLALPPDGTDSSDPQLQLPDIDDDPDQQATPSASQPTSSQPHAPQPPSSTTTATHPINPALHPQALPAQQQQVVDLTGTDNPTPGAGFDPDTAVPTTPPEAHMDEPLLPSKRPFDALLNGTMQARLVQNGQFELHNYEPAPLKKLSSRTTSVDLKELHCWARLDVDSNEYQQTMSSGPPWSRVYFRRTIDAKTGEIINQEEAPQPEMDIQLPQAMTIITELWHLPQPHECYFVGYEDGIIPMEAGWDGGPETTSPIESSTFFDVYATKLATSENDTTTTINDDSDVDLENMAYGESPAAQLTRQQAKALEKELPVSQIMTMPENNIHEFVKAAVKEADSWDRWHCIRPVPPAEAERIQRDPQPRKRIITARCCYRDKAKGKPPLKAKARMVAHGHLDPDIRSLSRNAATPTRISEMLLLAIYISGLHGMAFRTRRPVDAMGWRCYDSVLAGRSRRHRTSWQTFHEAQAGRDPQKSKGVPELSLRDSRQRLWTLQRPGHMGKGSDTAPARARLRPPLIRPHVFLLPGLQQGRKFCTLRHFDLLRGRLSTYLQPQVSLRQVLPEVRMGITRTPGARQALHLQGKADQPC